MGQLLLCNEFLISTKRAIHSSHQYLGNQRAANLVGQLVKIKFQMFRTNSVCEDSGAQVDSRP